MPTVTKKKPARKLTGQIRKMLPTQTYCWVTYCRLVKLNALRFERIGIDLTLKGDKYPAFWIWVMVETGGTAVSVTCDKKGFEIMTRDWFNGESRRKWGEIKEQRIGYEDATSNPEEFIANLLGLKLPAKDWTPAEPPGYKFSWEG
jgi:hypothetical protein